MNNISRNIKNEDGSEDTIVISSADEYNLNMNKKYRIANHQEPKTSRLSKKFKGSILGADIGAKSGGFGSVAIMASIIAIGAVLVMYFIWRF